MTIIAFNVIIYSITSILLTMLVAPDEPLECSIGPYISRTVIQSGFGTGEGEFGTTMWLGEVDYPGGLAVDDNGNIFILDHLNNRIQEFDASGEYLRSIDVISFQNGADSTWNGWTGPWPTIHGDYLYLYEDYLYVPIWRGFNKYTAEPKAIYKYDLDGNMHEVSLTEYEEMLLHVCPETLTFNNELLITLNEQGVTIDSGSVVTTIGLRCQGDYIKLDKYGNLWVILYTIPGIAQIFNLHGDELGQLHQRTCLPGDMGLTPPYIDSNGNIWQIRKSQCTLRVVSWEIPTTVSAQTIANSDISDVHEHSYDLITAACLGYTERVQSLLDEGVDPEFVNRSGETALISAAKSGYFDIVRLLREAGADGISDNELALLEASFDGRTDDVRDLLQTGIDVDGAFAIIALKEAASRGFNEILELHLCAGVDPNTGNRTIHPTPALLAAVNNNHTQSVRILLDYGADPNSTDNYEFGQTALRVAAASGNAEIVRILLEAGANPDLRDENAITPLMGAVAEGHAEIVQLLLDAGVDVNAVGIYNSTAIRCAAITGDPDILQIILDAGGGVHVNTAGILEGTTPLMFASEKGHMEVAQILLSTGADIDARNLNDETAAMLATEQGHFEIVRLLTDAGADSTLDADLPTDPYCSSDGSILVLHKELSGYRNYGESDRASDILYSGESATWTFTHDSYPDLIPAHFTIQGVMDDHYTVPEKHYTITITLNEQEVFNGSAERYFKHGRPHGTRFTNWRQLHIPAYENMQITITNTSQLDERHWIAIDWIELSVVERLEATGVVITQHEPLSVREGPGLEYDVIESAAKDETLEITGNAGEWFYVRLRNETEGYVSSTYIEINE